MVPVSGNGVRVLVVDHIRLHRENLISMLSRESTIAGASGASDATEAIGRLGAEGFDVALLNMAVAGGDAICRELSAVTNVVALAVSDDEELVACAEAGVVGYLLRDDSPEALVSVIATAARGETSCPPQVAAVLMRQMSRRGRPAPVGATSRLTGREMEILRLIDEGMSNKEIARKLFIEVRTVKNHVHNLLEKLSVHRRGEAAALLRSEGSR